MNEAHCRITGRVHMVMYRSFAKSKADVFGIKGTVKNLPDGSVEVIAQGDKRSLQSYIELLKQGPALAKVKSVDVVFREPGQLYKSFEILR